MSESKRRDTKIKEAIASIKETYPDTSIFEVQKRINRWNNFSFAATFAGPIITSAIACFFPPKFTFSALFFKEANNWFAILSIITVIITGAFFHWKFSFYQSLLFTLQNDEQIQKKNISTLQAQIQNLKHEVAFYIGALQMIARVPKNSSERLIDLAQSVVACVYNDCKHRFNLEQQFSVNLYELNGSKIRMLAHYQPDSFDANPLLFKEEGTDIHDEQIKDFYCVKSIMRQAERVVIGTWQDMVQKFKWDHWPDGFSKEQILQDNDRETCLNSGFRYNQYIGLKFSRSDGIVAYLEIIAFQDVTFAPQNRLSTVSRQLQEKYLPLVYVLWDIVNNK